MTPQSPATANRMTPLTSAAAIGGALVFLLASAALLNAFLGHRPLPADLRKAAVAAHLASVMLALPLGVAQLVLPKGTPRHRVMGYAWLVLMDFTALVSFAVHTINPKGLSPIHIFSIVTLATTPLIVFAARRGDIAAHRRGVLGLIIGGLGIAGLFAFMPGRAMGDLFLRLIGQG